MTVKEQLVILVSNDVIPAKTDAIVLLEGDGFSRISTACDLIKNKYADKLVFSGGIDNPSYGSYTYDKCLPYILEAGVNEEQIITELESQHTREQAKFVVEKCLEYKWKSFVLVASHYHQCRAFLTFLKILQETELDKKIRVYNKPALPAWHEPSPWGKRIDLLKSEFEKIGQYTKLGHIATYESALVYLGQRDES